MILVGKLRAGLYNVEAHKNNAQSADLHHYNKVCLAAVENAKLWNLRLGYLPFDQLKIVRFSPEIRSV